MKIDLHSHTHYSDGRLSPSELVMRAQNLQVDVLAITDHDTVAAVQEAVQCNAEYQRPMQIIPGIELSTSWHGFDIHVLGLNVDVECPQFLERLNEQSQARQFRAEEIAKKLQKAGVPNVLEKVKSLAGKGQITRSHFAQALVQLNVVNDHEQAFKLYLGKGKKAHMAPKWISVGDAVQWILDAGGTPVLAHPSHYKMTAKWLRRLLVEFKSHGGIGMEVIHPRQSPVLRRQMINYALEYELKASLGSDFHYPNQWTELGKYHHLPEQLTPVWHDWNLKVA